MEMTCQIGMGGVDEGGSSGKKTGRGECSLVENRVDFESLQACARSPHNQFVLPHIRTFRTHPARRHEFVTP